jgi:hypothetical protein
MARTKPSLAPGGTHRPNVVSHTVLWRLSDDQLREIVGRVPG